MNHAHWDSITEFLPHGYEQKVISFFPEHIITHYEEIMTGIKRFAWWTFPTVNGYRNTNLDHVKNMLNLVGENLPLLESLCNVTDVCLMILSHDIWEHPDKDIPKSLYQTEKDKQNKQNRERRVAKLLINKLWDEKSSEHLFNLFLRYSEDSTDNETTITKFFDKIEGNSTGFKYIFPHYIWHPELDTHLRKSFECADKYANRLLKIIPTEEGKDQICWIVDKTYEIALEEWIITPEYFKNTDN